MKGRVFIYGLVDPRNFLIRYIGQTAYLRNRFIVHCRSVNKKSPARVVAWLKDLEEMKMIPSMVVLETSQDGGCGAAKARWIRKYKRENELLNHNAVGQTAREFRRVTPAPVEKSLTYISIAEAASLTGRPAVTIRWWARNRKVRRYKSGTTWLVYRLDVLAYEGERRRGGGRR